MLLPVCCAAVRCHLMLLPVCCAAVRCHLMLLPVCYAAVCCHLMLLPVCYAAVCCAADIFFFDYGVVACWGMTKNMEWTVVRGIARQVGHAGSECWSEACMTGRGTSEWLLRVLGGLGVLGNDQEHGVDGGKGHRMTGRGTQGVAV